MPCVLTHHKIWGNTNCIERGEDLLKYLGNNNIDVLNLGKKLIFVTKNRQEVLDITLGDRGEGHICDSNWHVSSEFSEYDQKYIRFDIVEDPIRLVTEKKPRRTNREKFKEEIKQGMKDCPNTTTNSVEVETLNDWMD